MYHFSRTVVFIALSLISTISTAQKCPEATARQAVLLLAADPNIDRNTGGVKPGGTYTLGCDLIDPGYVFHGNNRDAYFYYNCTMAKALAVWGGGIRHVWGDAGGESGKLGWPVSCNMPTPTKPGEYCRFQHGNIYYSHATSSHIVYKWVMDAWGSQGWEQGWMGFPTGDLKSQHVDISPTGPKKGRIQTFEGGVVYVPEFSILDNPAYALWGPVWNKYDATHALSGALGWPTSNVMNTNGFRGGQYAQFEGGSIYDDVQVGSHWVPTAIDAKYIEIGGPGSKLAMPIADPTWNKGWWVDGAQNFEGGRIALVNGKPQVYFKQ